jgi:hypothetical protein
MPGSFTDRIQRSEMLREMDNTPRRSTHVPVPNPWYYNTDNVAIRGRRLGYAELLAAAYIGRDVMSQRLVLLDLSVFGYLAFEYLLSSCAS